MNHFDFDKIIFFSSLCETDEYRSYSNVKNPVACMISCITTTLPLLAFLAPRADHGSDKAGGQA